MGALDGKIAIVTGATSGIGEGIAKAFVSEGAKVVIAARREDEGRALEQQLGVRFVRTDVANEADVKAMVDKTVEWFGRVDCLVNNAGIPAPMVSITEVDVATIDQVLAINVKGVVLGDQARSAGHARAAVRQHRQYRQRGRTSRRALRSCLHRLEGRCQRVYPLRGGRAWRKGNPRQLPLARRDCDRNFWEKRGARRLEG